MWCHRSVAENHDGTPVLISVCSVPGSTGRPVRWLVRNPLAMWPEHYRVLPAVLTLFPESGLW